MAGDQGNNKYIYGGNLMKSISIHVEEMFSNVPDSEQRDEIMRDIKQNLEDKVLDLMEQGKSEEDAINKAIVEFGDIEDIKKELTLILPDKKNRAYLNLGFSIGGSLLIILMSLFMNYYYSPHTIWFVYPTFLILWWPLSMFYVWMRSK